MCENLTEERSDEGDPRSCGNLRERSDCPELAREFPQLMISSPILHHVLYAHHDESCGNLKERSDCPRRGVSPLDIMY